MSLAHLVSRSLPLALLLGSPTLASAGTLILAAGGTLDISNLNIGNVGDLAFGDGRIWVADGTIGGLIYGLNESGTLLNTVDPGVIPGFTRGADALSVSGATSLIAFSSFGESAAGRFHWTDGNLTSAYASAQEATGASFFGGLWIASGTTVGAGSKLLRLDSSTGAIVQTVLIPGLTARIVDLDVDPVSGGIYALCEDDQLRQIDIATGAILATQDLAPLLIGHLSVAGGLTFNNEGTRLYVANGPGAGADSIVVLNRAFSANVCGSFVGTFTCPCSNTGGFGKGCRNSTAGGNGAFLTSTGIPRIGQDSFVIQSTGLPPGTFVLFFQGTTLNQPTILFGDGALCAGGAVVRLGVEAAPTGFAQYPGNGENAIGLQGQIPGANAKRLYQGWYRDSASFCTSAVFNLTNAIEAEWL